MYTFHHGVFFLLIQSCFSYPLHPRSQGTPVSSVTPTTTENPGIIPGWKNPTAIVLLVAVVSLALAIPMFVYIWLKRRRLLRVRTQSQAQVVARKASFASTVDMPLTARVESSRKSMGVETEETGDVGSEVATEVGTTVGTPMRSTIGTTSTVTGVVAFAEPVKISAKPIRAVEIMVKPARAAKAVFKDPSWEKLKS